MNEIIKLAQPDIKPEDIQRAIEVIESGNLVQGQQVMAFESMISQFLTINNCAVVSSCTAALHLALKAIGVKPGDVVIVPAFTFPATANVVENLGAEVLFCEVEPETYVMSPEYLAALIEAHQHKNIKAILVVHAFGYPAAMKEIASLANKRQIKLIEDAACALGTISDGQPVGYYSEMACFSFHPRKALTTGEGGAVVSRQATIIESIKRLRNHGIEVVDGRIDFVEDGLNYRMTDFQAALALGQMDRFKDTLAKRRKMALHYHDRLKNCHEISIPKLDDGHSWQSFMVVLRNSCIRDLLINKLYAEKIQTNLGAQALNCLSYFQKKYGITEASFPVATKLYKQGLVLPLHGQLTLDQIDRVCETLIKILR